MSLKLTDFSFHCSQLFGNSGDCEVEINHCHLHHPCLVSSAGPRIQWLPFLNVWPDGSPENGHTPHGQRSAFQSFNGGGVVHFFQMQQKHSWHQKIFTLNDENTETPVPSEHHCIVATHNMEYSNLRSSAVWSHFCQVMMLHRDSTRKM